MQATLRPANHLTKVYLYRDPIDFRKSHRGLSAIVESELGHDPFSGCQYAFTNKQRNKIKCLFWEDNGFVLYYKCSYKCIWLKNASNLELIQTFLNAVSRMKANSLLIHFQSILDRKRVHAGANEALLAKILDSLEKQRRQGKKSNIAEIAREFGLSRQRVHKIINDMKKDMEG